LSIPSFMDQRNLAFRSAPFRPGRILLRPLDLPIRLAISREVEMLVSANGCMVIAHRRAVRAAGPRASAFAGSHGSVVAYRRWDEDDRDVFGRRWPLAPLSAACADHGYATADQLGRQCRTLLPRAPAKVELDVVSFNKPFSLSACMNAGCLTGPVLPASSIPITGSGCCARAASGHVDAALPMSLTNSRRFNRRNCIRCP